MQALEKDLLNQYLWHVWSCTLHTKDLMKLKRYYVRVVGKWDGIKWNVFIQQMISAGRSFLLSNFLSNRHHLSFLLGATIKHAAEFEEEQECS